MSAAAGIFLRRRGALLLVFVNIRRKLLAILYRLCYTVPVGCGRGGFFAVLRGRGGFLLLVGSCEAGARKEPLSVERTAKRAARRAPFGGMPVCLRKMPCVFRAGVLY